MTVNNVSRRTDAENAAMNITLHYATKQNIDGPSLIEIRTPAVTQKEWGGNIDTYPRRT